MSFDIRSSEDYYVVDVLDTLSKWQRGDFPVGNFKTKSLKVETRSGWTAWYQRGLEQAFEPKFLEHIFAIAHQKLKIAKTYEGIPKNDHDIQLASLIKPKYPVALDGLLEMKKTYEDANKWDTAVKLDTIYRSCLPLCPKQEPIVPPLVLPERVTDPEPVEMVPEAPLTPEPPKRSETPWYSKLFCCLPDDVIHRPSRESTIFVTEATPKEKPD